MGKKEKERTALIDEIRRLPEDTLLYIGSRSNFLWIGQQRFAVQAMNELSQIRFEKVKDALDHAQRLYNKAVLNNKRRDISYNADELRKARNRIDDFVPFTERKVKEVYRRETDGGTVIIIEGNEQGTFWENGKILIASRGT